MTTEMAAPAEPGAVEELAGRLFVAGVGAAELCTAYMSIHLGLYRALADAPASAAELAQRAGCDERYLREWLQAQAISGLLAADGADPATARFTLAEGVHEVLVDETGPAYLGGLADIVAAAGRVLPLLASAYRAGEGVPYAAYGPDGVSAQAALNRPAFVNSLVAEWLPQLPGVLARLRTLAPPGWRTHLRHRLGLHRAGQGVPARDRGRPGQRRGVDRDRAQERGRARGRRPGDPGGRRPGRPVSRLVITVRPGDLL
jgi:hypothetical protein